MIYMYDVYIYIYTYMNLDGFSLSAVRRGNYMDFGNMGSKHQQNWRSDILEEGNQDIWLAI